jgi:hypothetical protein
MGDVVGWLLAWMVVFLMVGPPVVMLAGGLLLAGAAMLPGTSRRVRERFWCPWKSRLVTVDFFVPPGAAHPSEVAACTAFRHPTRVLCQRACREVADVRWAVPPGMFPRWALTAGGPISWRSVAERPGGAA